MRLGYVLLVGLAAHAVCAQDVRLTISAATGRSSFYIGEAIELKLEFAAANVEGLQFDHKLNFRTTRGHTLDSYEVTPKEGTADPLGEAFSQYMGGIAGSGPMFVNQPPLINEFLNEWVSFRKPGKYVVRLTSNRALKSKRPATAELPFPPTDPIPVESNPIEIEIVEPPPGWASQTLARALSKFQDVRNGFLMPEQTEAARTVRFLGTRESVAPMAELLSQYPDAQFPAGLWGYPDRPYVIQTMERLLTAPNTPINGFWLGTLVELAARAELPPLPPMPLGDDEKMKEWNELHKRQTPVVQKHSDRYERMLLDSLSAKSPAARAACAMTLAQRPGVMQDAELRKALLAGPLDSLPIRQQILTDLWPVVAAPDAAPVLKRMIAQQNPELAWINVFALHRLHDLDPRETRRIVLDEIRKNDSRSPLRQQFVLPDRELPGFDEHFVQVLKEPNPPWLLIARYGTRTLLPAVKSELDEISEPCDFVPLLYLFRFDPEDAASRLARLRSDHARPGCGHIAIPGDPRDFMSEGLEDALIGELGSSKLEFRRYAAFVLGNAGSPRAEPALWKAAEKGFDQPGLEQTFVVALMNAWSWLPTVERIDRMEKLCSTDWCRDTIKRHREALSRPRRLDIMEHTGRPLAMEGGVQLSMPGQLKSRLGLYPPNTAFAITLRRRGTWYMQRLESQLMEIFEAAGMKLVVSDPAAP